MNSYQLKALADAEYDRALHRKNLKENAEALLNVPFAGGLFLASTALISYLATESDEYVYLIDIFGTPVRANRVQMLAAVKDQYNRTMQSWYEDYQASNKIRRANNV